MGGGPVTRDELEATIWRTMTAHRVRCPHPNLFVDAILLAADKHVFTASGITAERRAVLAGREPQVHWTRRLGGEVSVCGKIRVSSSEAPMTADVAGVTCGSCKRTTAYLEALGDQIAAGAPC